MHRLRPKEVVKTFEHSVKQELDLRIEAACAAQLAHNCKNDKNLKIPHIYWSLTGEKMLTTEWVDGMSILDVDALEKAGLERKEVAKTLAVNFFNQVYRDGFFHADTHPGNLFIDAHGRLIMVDFGIMGRLDEDTRIFVARILHGFLTGDYDAVARVHFEAGYVPQYQSREEFAIACRAIGEPILGLPSQEVSIAKLLALLFKVTEDFDMQTQPQLLLLQKTMVLVEGIGAALYPQVNLWQLAEDWIQDWAKKNLSAKAEIRRKSIKFAEQLMLLPETLKKLQIIIADEYERKQEKKP
jgi:ubiquinone biosynthesis protein